MEGLLSTGPTPSSYINIKYIMHFYIYIVEIFPGKFIISCMHRKIFHYMKNFLDENFPSIQGSAVKCSEVQCRWSQCMTEPCSSVKVEEV